MMNNRLLNLSIILLIAITLLGVVTFVLYKYLLVPSNLQASSTNNPPSVESLHNRSVATGDITTNLKDGRYIVVNFTIICENKKVKGELEKGMFMVQNEIIRALSSQTIQDLSTEEGINSLEARLTTGFNSFLQKGKVEKVVTTNKLFQ